MKPANIGKSIPKVKQVGQQMPPIPVPNPNAAHPLMQHIHHPVLRRRFMMGYMKGMLKAHMASKKKGGKGILGM